MASSEEAFLRLLGSAEGVRVLLEGGEALGVQAKASSWKNLVNFGYFSKDNLESCVPFGYEEEETEEQGGFLSQTISISVKPGRSEVEKFMLKSYMSLPNKEEKSYWLEVVTEEGDEAVGETIRAGETCSVRVRLKIHPQFSGGLINEVLLLTLCGEKRHSTVSLSTAECTLGLRVQGTMMSPREVKLSQQLSHEAVPFTPQVALTYFDQKCPFFTLSNAENSTLGGRSLYTTPLGFSRAIVPPIEVYWGVAMDYANLPTKDFVNKYISKPPSIPKPLDFIEYLRQQDMLNKVEYLQMISDIRHFDMRYTSLTFFPPLEGKNKDARTMTCKFVVKGASENRPKINPGDLICFRPALEYLAPNNLNLFELRGVVTDFKLKNEMVTCVCPVPHMAYICQDVNVASTLKEDATSVCRKINLLKYHIRFTFDTSGVSFIDKTLRVMMTSVPLRMMLFPEMEYKLRSPLVHLLQFKDKMPMDLDLNREQKEAVETVCALYLRNQNPHDTSSSVPTPPYIIFGPPGTGKTKTVISIIRGMLAVSGSCTEHPRVLACAPSDAAADVLCTRLAAFYEPDELFRLNWWQRPLASVPMQLLKYSKTNESSLFDIPNIEKLKQFKIIVCTSVAAGVFDRDMNIGTALAMQFDLVVIDEVSQATELESLVPVSLVKSSGVVVLSGDPEQLGPVPRSPAFLASGKQMSLQERLLQHPMYENVRPAFDDDVVEEESDLCKFGVYLRHNYRSQESIFHVPSSLFYHGSLLESGVESELDCLSLWEELSSGDCKKQISWNCNDVEHQERPFLVLFRSVTGGVHKHELDSPSFYNTLEISSVVELCSSLILSSAIQVSPKDIGVIGAFRSQVLKLRQSLREANLGNVNVGGIEDFQGQESKVIIISTVLSGRVRQLEINDRLGLCGDHRKFNVAITRAKCLCIVVGNPYYLHEDPCWRNLMNYCDKHGTFTGDPCSLLESVRREEMEEEELLQNAAKISLLGMGDSSDGLSRQTYANPYYGSELEWRGLL